MMNNVSVQYERCSILQLLFAHEHVVKEMKLQFLFSH